MSPNPALVARLARHGQDHLLRWWPELDEASRAELVAELEALDLEQLDGLIARFVKEQNAAEEIGGTVEPVEVVRLPKTDGERIARRHVADVGAALLSAGEVGVVLVAGGSGTRLGFDAPKGTFPIGPVSGASLFQIHAEKIVAMGRRYGKPLPLYIMTSPENHEQTVEFFDEHDRFGLPHIRFFTQGRYRPWTHRRERSCSRKRVTSRSVQTGTAARSPHLRHRELAERRAVLDEMRDRGVKTLFYFQVDNPLVKIADPAFLGHHAQAQAEMSFKVIEKLAPDEKLGVVVRAGGQPRVIEYSDLPAELAERREPDGSLELWAGSIAVHILERTFVERLVAGAQLPFHRALKKVPHVDEQGALRESAQPNAVKFERFIFDALPLAERWALVETSRTKEFEPLKNATGPDSPATVRQRMSDLSADWLERAGVTKPPARWVRAVRYRDQPAIRARPRRA